MHRAEFLDHDPVGPNHIDPIPLQAASPESVTQVSLPPVVDIDPKHYAAHDPRDHALIPEEEPDDLTERYAWLQELIVERSFRMKQNISETPDDPFIEKIIFSLQPILRRFINATIKPQGIYDNDDHLSIANLALLKLLDSYDPEKDSRNSFLHFIMKRIPQAIMDAYRTVSPHSVKIPRSHFVTRRFVLEYSGRNGVEPNDADVGIELGIDPKTVRSHRKRLAQLGGRLASLDRVTVLTDPDEEGHLGGSPASCAPDTETIVLYNMTLEEIGLELIYLRDGMTESRREVLDEHLLGSTTLSELAEKRGVSLSAMAHQCKKIEQQLLANRRLRVLFRHLLTLHDKLDY